MSHNPRLISLASAAALALALGQTPVLAQAPAAAPAKPAPAPSAPAPAAPAAPAAAPAADQGAMEAARAKADERRAQMEAERNKRYDELRARAAEVGLELPATPPWQGGEAGMPKMPEGPAMPPYRGMAPGTSPGMSPEDWEAMRAKREAMREKFQSMTPEERKAMREAHWKEMRERAAERGVELPETPPWAEAEERYKAAQEQFEKYRKIVDELTPEQAEAARAVFGGGRGGPGMGDAPAMPPMGMPYGHGYGPGPQGGYPGFGPYQGGPGTMPMGRPPMPFGEGSPEQGSTPPQAPAQ